MEKLRISAISYSNTCPFVYGLLHSEYPSEVEIQLDVPSSCSRKLRDGSADVGIIPVAGMRYVPGAHIFSQYCIGADGPVKTVLLLSNSPINEVHTVLLDSESETSVRLTRLLMKEYWELQPEYKPLDMNLLPLNRPGYAAVLIGDKAVKWRDSFTDVWDLAEVWRQHTGLPFVFACWVAGKPLSPEMEMAINNAFSYGLNHIDQAIAMYDPQRTQPWLKSYLTENVSYILDGPKREGMNLFLQKIGNYGW